MMRRIYLSHPYGHKSLTVMQRRVEQADIIAARLMMDGSCYKFSVYSPLTHSHRLANHMAESYRTDHSFWLAVDYHEIDLSTDLFVVLTEGTKSSYGVKKEIEYAQAKDMPLYYFTAAELKKGDYIERYLDGWFPNLGVKNDGRT